MSEALPTPAQISELVSLALAEDKCHEDVSSLAVVPESSNCKAQILARADGVIAGMHFALEAFRQIDSSVQVQVLANDGEQVRADQVLLYIVGNSRSILAAERVALNFLQQLSGVATATALAQAAAKGVTVMDTRKTTPGLRDAQKYAVRVGGGKNQRRDLNEELLLKENHFTLSGRTYADTVRLAVSESKAKVVGIEAETIEQAEQALAAGANYVLLDNFHGVHLVAAVAKLRAKYPNSILEASGGYTLDNLPALANAGVDRVSMGSLTHSVIALDMSLLLKATND
ncbi:MAG: carboxylating nicotinate-nucleotide diphosphorylase [Planctomycetota bacterium]|nr:carboxylating nicotinate-nucleotide diphosphorylase [Planctomycetota bacterium]